MRTWVNATVVTILTAAWCVTAALGQDKGNSRGQEDNGSIIDVSKSARQTEQAGEASAGLGVVAMAEAVKANKYLFVFFHKTEDSQTQAARKTLDTAMERIADRALSVAVNITDPSEKAIVNKFGVSRAPMPLILVLAPNGAITRAFVRNFDEKEFAEAFVSPCEEECLKLLQGRKLVFVCVQNESTQNNAEAMEGVQQFKADKRYARLTEIVTVDPSDETEVEFLKKVRVDPATEEAITVVLAPPGRLIGTFKGAITKNTLVAAVQKSASGCGPKGCGPKGCGPPKKNP